MSTEKQIQANRRNAQRSTGPRTPEGKAKSSLNALKHGRTSAQVPARSEDADDFNAYVDSLRDHLAPADALESILVEQIIVATQRLARTLILERSILERATKAVQAELEKDGVHYTDPGYCPALAFRRECAGGNALEKLSRLEARIQGSFYQALRELDRCRARGPASRASQEPPILQNEPVSAPAPANSPYTRHPSKTSTIC